MRFILLGMYVLFVSMEHGTEVDSSVPLQILAYYTKNERGMSRASSIPLSGC